jgi:hypothetical protein
MRSIFNLTFFKHRIIIIIVTGFFLRLLYVLFFSKYHAQSYYGEANIFAKGPDISMWLDCLNNLITHGSYSADINDPDGYFARMPGYAFFISIFYFLPGTNTYLYFLSFFQVICDTLNIYFIYRISEVIFNRKQVSYAAAILYAVHPMNILWAPFLSAESPAVFLMLFSLFIFVCSKSNYKYFGFGFVAGFNILMRPQMALFALVYFLYFLYAVFRDKKKSDIKHVIVYGLGITLSYGWWPTRNLILHHELIITHRITAIKCWGEDIQAYSAYIYSVQSKWQPQFNQILKNQPIEIDKENAYKYPPDSALLAKTFFLCQNYSSGFSEWPGYWKEPLTANKFDTIIIENFNTLKQHQLEYNGYHYWVILPLENLKKCFFKIELVSNSNSSIKIMAVLLFLFRTFIILTGIVGTFVIIARHGKIVILLNFLFFISWYLIISAGDTYLLRNIEMRYLLQCDTLLILPAAYLLSIITFKKTE